jgi:hypothetical protein
MTSTITQQLRALHDLSAAQLAARYEQLHGKPPRVRNRAFLLRRVAWKLQEREFGGLPERAKNRLDEMIAAIDLPLRDPAPPRPRGPQRGEAKGPMVGTTLLRRWHDQEIRVEVRDGGFEWQSTLYKSLSAVAKAITGANWNGKLFFGLTQRKAGA